MRPVASALNYLQLLPRLGRNNLILADVEGQLAVFENAHSRSSVLETENSFMLATNHFNSLALQDCFVDTEPPSLQGNTFHRWMFNKGLPGRPSAGRLRNSLVAVHAPGARHGVAEAWHNRGIVLREEGALPDARQATDRALDLFRVLYAGASEFQKRDLVYIFG